MTVPGGVNMIHVGGHAVEAMRLADAIEELGNELREAQRRAAADKKPDLLKVKECTIELAVTWEKTGEAGIEWKVINLSGGLTKSDVQTITLTLEPMGEIIATTE